MAGNRGNRGSTAAELETQLQAPVTTTTHSGTSYTFTPGDAATLVEFTSATAVTAIVPPNSAAPFPVGATILLRQYGAGQVGVVGGVGVTVHARGGALDLAGQYAQATLIKRATNEWVLSGDVTVVLGS